MDGKIDKAIKEIREVQEQREKQDRIEKFKILCPYTTCFNWENCCKRKEVCIAREIIVKTSLMDVLGSTFP